jgi:hypothetical protein
VKTAGIKAKPPVESNGGRRICQAHAAKLHYNAGLLRERAMPIDWASVNWGYFGLLLLLVFLASLIGSFAGAYRRVFGAVIATVVFGLGFVAWNYYPHGLRLPNSPKQQAAAPAPTPASAPAAPSAPVRPANPFRDITPRQ